MNCKQGDLAIYVGTASPQDVGMIVRCVKFVGIYPTGSNREMLPNWEIDPPLKRSPYRKDIVADAALRPIRPNDGEDEMIRIAGKPRETDVPNPQVA